MLLSLISAASLAMPPRPPQVLASLVDKHRVLLLFAPNRQDPRYLRQLTLLERHTAELRERDVVLVPDLREAGPPVDANMLRPIAVPLSNRERVLSRRQYGIGSRDFTVILLGKDGGEKLRSRTPLPIERLDGTIDAMPMRQEEMRQKR